MQGGGRCTSWFDIVTWPVGLAEPEGPTGIDDTVKRVHKMLEEIEADGIPSNRILIGGFSQARGCVARCTLDLFAPRCTRLLFRGMLMFRRWQVRGQWVCAASENARAHRAQHVHGCTRARARTPRTVCTYTHARTHARAHGRTDGRTDGPTKAPHRAGRSRSSRACLSLAVSAASSPSRYGRVACARVPRWSTA